MTDFRTAFDRLGLTIETAATLGCVSPATVASWMSGTRRPQKATLARIADADGNPAWLELHDVPRKPAASAPPTSAEIAAHVEARRARYAAYQEKWRAANREKLAAYTADYRRDNNQKVVAYQAAYYRASRDKIVAQRAAFRAANPEKKPWQQRAYSAAHREKIAARQAAFRAANREKIAAQRAAYRAARREKKVAAGDAVLCTAANAGVIIPAGDGTWTIINRTGKPLSAYPAPDAQLEATARILARGAAK